MNIQFVDIVDCKAELQQEVRIWRNSEKISQFMYSSHQISDSEHQNWLKSLLSNPYTKSFIVFSNDNPIGLANYTNYNKTHQTVDWGFYVYDENALNAGTGAIVEYLFIDYLFENLDIHKINCEVLSTNPAVVKLHKRFGFVEEGIKRQNILKGNERIDVVIMGLLKEDWKVKKEKYNFLLNR